MTAEQATQAVEWVKAVGVGGIATAALTAVAGVVSRRAAARRAVYAEMTATLAAWAELPYRIRRRVSDDPAALAELTGHLHGLQEQLVRQRAALRAECQWLADRRDAAENAIKADAAAWIREAWAMSPAAAPVAMNLNGWGPTELHLVVEGFACELRWRFGWRRASNPLRRLAHWPKARRRDRQVARTS